MTVSMRRKASSAFTEITKGFEKAHINILSIVEMAELSMLLASDMDFLKGEKSIIGDNMSTLFRKMRVASTKDKPKLRDNWIKTVAEILNPKKMDEDKETTPGTTLTPDVSRRN